ncbi:hypothetical protein ACUXHH_001318 [Rothia sp. 110740021-2]
MSNQAYSAEYEKMPGIPYIGSTGCYMLFVH